MSYKSNVRICTTKKGFDMIKEFVSDKTDGTCTRNLLNCIDEKIIGKDRDFILFGWDWIKWYDMLNDDVIAVMGALNYINDKNIPFNYIRVGESSEGDVEEWYRDLYNVLPWMSVDTIINYDKSIKKPKSYYALFRCDEWKSKSSMSLVGVFTQDRLISQLNKEIEEGDMEFGRDGSLNALPIRDIESSLKYGFIQELSINEVL